MLDKIDIYTVANIISYIIPDILSLIIVCKYISNSILYKIPTVNIIKEVLHKEKFKISHSLQQSLFYKDVSLKLIWRAYMYIESFRLVNRDKTLSIRMNEFMSTIKHYINTVPGKRPSPFRHIAATLLLRDMYKEDIFWKVLYGDEIIYTDSNPTIHF